MYVFVPVTRTTHFQKQTADKLARWASRLYEYQFGWIRFPDGCLLNQSRQTSLSLCGLSPVLPLNQAEFVCPTLDGIKKRQ